VFNDLQAKTILDVVDVMKPLPIAAGTNIITQVREAFECERRII
jgi:hypothetical protein